MISTKIKYFESASYERGSYVPSHNDILAIKKKLDLPSLMIEFCNKHRADIQRISEEYELTFVLFIPVLDAPDLVRILRLGELSIHTSHSVG